jgi:hypothetical protein
MGFAFAPHRTFLFLANLQAVRFAPLAQGRLCARFFIAIPGFEHPARGQQVFKFCVGAAAAEEIPYIIHFVREFLLHEGKHQIAAKIEFPFVRQAKVVSPLVV